MNLENIENNNDDSLHSFIFARQGKPYASFDKIFSALIPYSVPISLAAGEVYQLGARKEESKIVLLLEGICSCCHKESQLHLGSMFAPSMLGMLDSYARTFNVSAWPEHYVIAETDCKGYSILLADFLELADRFELWHDVARILLHRLMIMSAREQELVGVDSYIKVKAQLIEVWAYPEAYRKRINILNFIQQRTGLSKSRIMKLLSELKKGGYIDIDAGKLTDLKKLPVAY
ncbi:helix-turn-helix domain-containing protein [Superficieibacter sp.]|uniref:winged helix-turn-helix transcriptional regulator n=1 Tax=Superficieibacter sp. TaxID=2303322 RepID=UPI0028AD9B7A|nr:helix-turn-helix domain-containing protein [Superficieibacter sp.]